MEAARSVIESFDVLVFNMEHADERFRKQISPLAIKNQFDRFKLWAANLGALNHGRASLDFRLMDYSLMKSTLLKFLNELRLVISKSELCCEFVASPTFPICFYKCPPPLL